MVTADPQNQRQPSEPSQGQPPEPTSVAQARSTLSDKLARLSEAGSSTVERVTKTGKPLAAIFVAAAGVTAAVLAVAALRQARNKRPRALVLVQSSPPPRQLWKRLAAYAGRRALMSLLSRAEPFSGSRKS